MPCVLILPGWKNSGPDHWQSHWERVYGYTRVEQHDWVRPRRGDWIAQLEEAVLQAAQPVVLVAHSLGCVQVAAWAAHSQHTARIQAALLVAPGDVEREDLRPVLPSWSPIPRQVLPFPSLLVASQNDPYCRFERASGLAQAWGATLVNAGACGHINAESNLGAWPVGQALLQQIMTTDR